MVFRILAFGFCLSTILNGVNIQIYEGSAREKLLDLNYSVFTHWPVKLLSYLLVQLL
jgi:hypothetical protein